MKTKIAITSLASLSPLGNTPEMIWANYLSPKTLISTKDIEGKNQLVATIPPAIRKEIDALRKEELRYKSLDETVLMAIITSRKAMEKAGWKQGDDFGINIGSSRGATQLFEKYHSEFVDTGKNIYLDFAYHNLGKYFLLGGS